MVRFPFILEMWYEEEAAVNPDGSPGWTEGNVREWRIVGRCNARQNGQARMVRGENGQAFLYSYEVTMPHDTKPIPLGTQVRIYDSRGVNIFDRTRNINDGLKNSNSVSYRVEGFYKSGQKYEDVKLWL